LGYVFEVDLEHVGDGFKAKEKLSSDTKENSIHMIKNECKLANST